MPLNQSLNKCYIMKILSQGEEEEVYTGGRVNKYLKSSAKALVISEPIAGWQYLAGGAPQRHYTYLFSIFSLNGAEFTPRAFMVITALIENSKL